MSAKGLRGKCMRSSQSGHLQAEDTAFQHPCKVLCDRQQHSPVAPIEKRNSKPANPKALPAMSFLQRLLPLAEIIRTSRNCSDAQSQFEGCRSASGTHFSPNAWLDLLCACPPDYNSEGRKSICAKGCPQAC